MKNLNKKEQQILRDIASFYGCKVFFKKDYNGGTWCGDYIVVGSNKSSYSMILSVFFHELAHFINWKTNKYPIYHNPKNFDKMHKIIPQFFKRVRYSLNAEIATEKLGAKLMKEWFPKVKYTAYYKNNKESYGYMTAYCIR